MEAMAARLERARGIGLQCAETQLLEEQVLTQAITVTVSAVRSATS